MFKRIGKISVVAVFALSIVTSFPLSTSAFNQNNIMNDAVFSDYNSMNIQQIDSFLNSYPNSCISPNSGFSAIDPIGYNPSQSFLYGGNVSAGTVIFNAAQTYGINPKVLLVTLQKEQSLVQGDAGCSTNRIAKAMGYGCPDSGGSYSYNGVNLYSRNGTTFTSVSGVCVNTAAKAGFTQQVIRAAWMLKYSEQRSKGNIGWAVIKGNWNNSDDLNATYSGNMTPGCHKRSKYESVCTQYDGYATINGSAVIMENGSTAALYRYTPHFAGNRSFVSIYTRWFGSPSYFGDKASIDSVYARQNCTISNFDNLSVARLYQPDTQDYLYTTNRDEACYAVKLGFIYDGLMLKAIPSTTPGATPIYRIAGFSRHFFTASLAEKNTLLSRAGYHDEGIAWYAYGSQVANTTAVTQLTDAQGVSLLTASGAEVNYYRDNEGMTVKGTAFYAPYSGAAPGSSNVYRLSKNHKRFYTNNVTERNVAISNLGYVDEGILNKSDDEANQHNMPVYRILGPGGHFFTTNRKERDYAVITYNYISEGTAFYALAYSPNPVYRLTNYQGGLRLFTNNPVEQRLANERYGYSSEGIGWYGY